MKYYPLLITHWAFHDVIIIILFYQYSNSYLIATVGRTEPNLDDISLTFREMGITIQDLSDYVSNVEPSSLPYDNLPRLPIRRENHLNFLKPGSSEVISRPVHVDEHLPPMHHIFLGRCRQLKSHYTYAILSFLKIKLNRRRTCY